MHLLSNLNIWISYLGLTNWENQHLEVTGWHLHRQDDIRIAMSNIQISKWKTKVKQIVKLKSTGYSEALSSSTSFLKWCLIFYIIILFYWKLSFCLLVSFLIILFIYIPYLLVPTPTDLHHIPPPNRLWKGDSPPYHTTNHL